MLIQGVVLSRWQGWHRLLWVGSCWALDQGGCALATVLNEVEVMIKLPPGLLPTHLQTGIQICICTLELYGKDDCGRSKL